MSLPEGDRYSKSKSKLLAELTMAMGGRAAEEIVFGADNVSNGASGDIKMATNQARMMVTEWGTCRRELMIGQRAKSASDRRRSGRSRFGLAIHATG